MKRFILAALALALAVAPARAQTHDSQGRPIFVPAPARTGLAGVSIRSTYPHNQNLIPNTAGGTFRAYYQIAATGTVYSISVCYQNISSTGATEQDGLGSLAGVTASLELSATPGATAPFTPAQAINPPTQFTFLGVQTLPGVVRAGGYLCSDELPVQMNPGQAYYVRSFIPNGVPYAAYQGLVSQNIELANNGSYNAIITGLTANGVQTVFNFTISTATTTGNPGTNIVLPLRAGTTHIAVGPASIFDDGAGNLTAAGVTGTLNYTTGVGQVTFTTPPANGTGFVASGLSRGGTTPADETMVSPGFAGQAAQYVSLITTLLPTFAPSMILGRVVATAPPQHTLCLFGDSIISGIGNATEDVAYPEYMSLSLGVLRFGQGSERAMDFDVYATSFRRMKAMLGHCDKVLTNYGHNDINVPRTLLQIQTDLLAVWSQLAATLPHGYQDITQAALSPYTTSSAVNTPINTNWNGATVAGGSPSMRNAVNNWMCMMTQALGMGFLDVNVALEANPATCAGAGDGTWASLTYTSDGRHYSNAGQKTRLPAVFGPNGSNPAPVFAP
jgi:hypothetical protein